MCVLRRSDKVASVGVWAFGSELLLLLVCGSPVWCQRISLTSALSEYAHDIAKAHLPMVSLVCARCGSLYGFFDMCHMIVRHRQRQQTILHLRMREACMNGSRDTCSTFTVCWATECSVPKECKEAGRMQMRANESEPDDNELVDDPTREGNLLYTLRA